MKTASAIWVFVNLLLVVPYVVRGTPQRTNVRIYPKHKSKFWRYPFTTNIPQLRSSVCARYGGISNDYGIYCRRCGADSFSITENYSSSPRRSFETDVMNCGVRVSRRRVSRLHNSRIGACNCCASMVGRETSGVRITCARCGGVTETL